MVQRTAELLHRLVESRFEFVVVGGVASIAHGSATFTQDLDVAASFEADNLQRLIGALDGVHPHFAVTFPRKPFPLEAAALTGFKNLYLQTDLGRLDVLSEVIAVGGYARVAASAVTRDFEGLPLRVIAIDDLIAAKTALGRPKDRQVEVELRAIRDRLKPR